MKNKNSKEITEYDKLDTTKFIDRKNPLKLADLVIESNSTILKKLRRFKNSNFRKNILINKFRGTDFCHFLTRWRKASNPA